MSEDQEKITRRNFLQGAKGWSAAVVALALTQGATSSEAEPTFGGGWLNRRGGGGGWLNNRGGGGGWLNNRGGGGWLNNRGGGGWLNRR